MRARPDFGVIGMRTRMRILSVAGPAIACLIGAAAVMALTGDSPREPSNAGARAFPQQGSSSDGGVTLSLLDATFSGTETIVHLRAEINAGRVPGLAGRSVRDLSVSRDGVEFQGAHVAATTLGVTSGDLLIQLPPVMSSSPSDSLLTIRSLDLTTSNGRLSLGGSWELHVELPSQSLLEDLLKTEQRKPRQVTTSHGTINISVLRSMSRTIVTYSLPDGLSPLAPVQMQSQQGWILPIEVTTSSGSVTASFERTAFGTAATIKLPDFTAIDDGSSTVTVRVGDAMKRSHIQPGQDAAFTYAESDIAPGATVNVVGGASGKYGQRQWFRVAVSGNWDFSNTSDRQPSAYAADGKPFIWARAGNGYTKAADGTVMPGETEIEFYYDSIHDLDQVTVLLDPPASIVRVGNTVTFD